MNRSFSNSFSNKSLRAFLWPHVATAKTGTNFGYLPVLFMLYLGWNVHVFIQPIAINRLQESVLQRRPAHAKPDFN